ncbi:MAG: hypothetical protein WBE41_23695 [Terracidiphilus sp.]
MMRLDAEDAQERRRSSRSGDDAGSHSVAIHESAKTNIRSHWPEWSILALYSALIAYAIPYHEPFADEAQAWQLARSLPLTTLFHRFIRYEGSPGLWHFLLWAMNRIHIGYAGMHWIAGAIAVCGVALLLFKSPLPGWLKFTLPFTYFLLFQYPVVARNYVLVPLLLFLVAIGWKKSPLGVAVALGLLANTALHAAAISGGLAVVYAIERWRDRAGGISREERRKLLLCTSLLVAFYAFAIWTAWPPHDLALSRVRGEHPNYLLSAVQSLIWGICQPPFLSVAFWVIVGLWFGARRKFLYLLPVLFFAGMSGFAYFTWWHAGLLVPLIVCLLWITWPEHGAEPIQFEKTLRVALGVMIATQTLWAGYAYVFDHYRAFSPDRAAAEFLEPYVASNTPIAVTYIKSVKWNGYAYPAVGILPYFDRNIFMNLPYTFWWWSDQDPTEKRFHELLPLHPRLVLVEVVDPGPIQSIQWSDPVFNSLFRNGYQFRSAFCGSQPQRFESAISICHVFLEYPQHSAATSR